MLGSLPKFPKFILYKAAVKPLWFLNVTSIYTSGTFYHQLQATLRELRFKNVYGRDTPPSDNSPLHNLLPSQIKFHEALIMFLALTISTQLLEQKGHFGYHMRHILFYEFWML